MNVWVASDVKCSAFYFRWMKTKGFLYAPPLPVCIKRVCTHVHAGTQGPTNPHTPWGITPTHDHNLLSERNIMTQRTVLRGTCVRVCLREREGLPYHKWTWSFHRHHLHHDINRMYFLVLRRAQCIVTKSNKKKRTGKPNRQPDEVKITTTVWWRQRQ